MFWLPQERDEWVAAIEQQILASLQGNESSGKKQSTTDPEAILAIKNTRGNNLCADCGAPGKRNEKGGYSICFLVGGGFIGSLDRFVSSREMNPMSIVLLVSLKN